MSNVKPTLVLAIIMMIVSALLIVSYKMTYVDKTGVLTDDLQAACEKIMGEGDFTLVSDWKAEGYAVDKPENIANLIKKSDGTLAFEIIADGYNKGGLDVLVAMNADGTVKNLTILANTETPGLGANANKRDFLDQFINAEGAKIASGGSGGAFKLTKSEGGTVNENAAEIDALTSATLSSVGVVNAVNTAVDTFKLIEGKE